MKIGCVTSRVSKLARGDDETGAENLSFGTFADAPARCLLRGVISKTTAKDRRLASMFLGPTICVIGESGLNISSRCQRELEAGGHPIELIAQDELHHIRREWLNDPNEPDWSDELPPSIDACMEMTWTGFSTKQERSVKSTRSSCRPWKSDIALHQRLSASSWISRYPWTGLAMRRGMADRIHRILTEEWESLETVLTRDENILDGGYQEEIDRLQTELESLDQEVHP